MDAGDIAWFVGACLVAWAGGFGAGVIHRALIQVMDAAS